MAGMTFAHDTMPTPADLRPLLQALEAAMRAADLWQPQPPTAEALASCSSCAYCWLADCSNCSAGTKLRMREALPTSTWAWMGRLKAAAVAATSQRRRVVGVRVRGECRAGIGIAGQV